MQGLRVLLLEGDVECRLLLREALAELGTRIASISEAQHLSEARRLLAAGAFDLCLVDLVLPDGLSIETIRFARMQSPAPTVLVVSSLTDEDTVVRAILAGASGFVSKDDVPADIARAIAIAAEGGSCISPLIAHRLMQVLRRQVPAGTSWQGPVHLTEREHGILQLATKGCNYRQIAELTGVRPSTVYTHVRHIYDKLQVSNLPQALFEARQRLLV